MTAWVIPPEQFLGSQNSAEQPVVPERPETIDAQMQQLYRGDRRAVMIPKGTKMPGGIQRGYKTIRPSSAGNFIFNPRAISPREIHQAVKFERLPEILGAIDGGMGAPDKTELRGPVSAVEGKDADGTTTQGTLADEGSLDSAIQQTAKVTPEYGTVSVTDPESVLAERMAWVISPEQFLQEMTA